MAPACLHPAWTGFSLEWRTSVTNASQLLGYGEDMGYGERAKADGLVFNVKVGTLALRGGAGSKQR